jgi:serralysin
MPLTRTVTAVTPEQDTFQDIDGLLFGIAWNLTTITYSYPNSSSDYGRRYGNSEPSSGFQALNANQRLAVDYAIDQFDSVTALSFERTAFGSSNDKSAIIRYAESNKPSTAWSYYPSEAPEGGDAWFNNAKHSYDNPVMGNYAWATFLHETGHALGLKHPHENKATFGVVDPARDSLEYTVMSYRSYVGDAVTGGYTNETWGFPQGLMMDDIAALQYMYGPDWTTNAGNTVYRWDPLTGQLFIRENDGPFSGEPQPGGNRIFMTVWDGGGTDTYDFSLYKTNLLVDLQPGQWTKTDTVNNYQTAHLDFFEGNTHLAAGNIANALTYKTYSNGVVVTEDLDSLIENAIGGSGNDVFMGNVFANSFTGGLGADTFLFADGWGTDTVQDWQDGVDKLDLTAVDDLTTYSQLTVTESEGNTEVSFAGQSIVLAGISLALIEATDFLI